MALALLEQPRTVPLQVADLHVRPTDIVFHNVAPGRVRLSVTVANTGDARSESETMTIQAAPLGAFVPWKDVTSLVIPPIRPHGSVEVATELSAPPPTRTLGKFSRVPPSKLLTAIAGGDESRPPAKPTNAWAKFLMRLLGRRAPENVPGQSTSQLPDDPLQLLSRPSFHWAGNINVLIGRRAVERHLAQALRIYPGHTNLAIFFVGDRRDEYQFTLSGDGAAWDAALFECPNVTSLSQVRSSSPAIPQTKWIPLGGCSMILLAVHPPTAAQTGSIEVHVRQRSTNLDALVEFTLDSHAAGPGCYTV